MGSTQCALLCTILEKHLWVGEMVQWVKTFAAQPADPGTHMEKGEK